MTYPENLKYAKSHEWVEFLEDGSARIGMTDYAQDQMGDLVFVNLPEPEDERTLSVPGSLREDDDDLRPEEEDL